LSNDHLASEQNISRRKIGVRNAIEHHSESDSADVATGLMLGGEGDRKETGILQIIDSDDPDIFGNSFPYGHECLHQQTCREVIGAEKRIRTIFLQNSFYKFLI